LVDYKWIVLSNTTLATVMSSLDANIVQIALPTIGKTLPRTSPFDLLWILVGYQLVITAFLVNFGRLSDMYGRVRLYNLGFAVFTVASGLCSFSQTGDQLAVFRMIQGVGGALIISNTATIITDSFPLKERGRALGTNQMTLVVGSVAGLIFGGFLTTLAGWQSIFWVNLPIGGFATVWSYLRLKESSVRQEGQTIDVKGNLSFASGLFLLLAGVTFRGVGTIDSLYLWGLTGGGAALIVLFVYIETKAPNPMLRLSLFKIPIYSGGITASALNSLARGAITVVLVFYLQSPPMSLSPLAAGVFLIPYSLSISVMGPLSGWLSDKYGPRILTTSGLVVSSVGLVLLAQIGPAVTFWQLALPLVLVGGGFGIFASPNRSSIMTSVPPFHRGVASSMVSTMNQFGMSLSRSLAFVIMAMVLPAGDIEKLFAGTLTFASASADNAFVDSIRLVFLVSTVLLLVSIIPSALKGKQDDRIDDGREPGPTPDGLPGEP
jgi:EmrB/QacA subfamily drug resistance transporter